MTNTSQLSNASSTPTNKWTTFTIVAIGVFMATLDSSIVNVSLPAIARAFGVPLSGAIEWVVIAYLVTTAAIILTAGRLADMIGHRTVWAVGLIVFTVASAVCGAAQSLDMLVAARALQGVGGALLFAVSPAMLTSAFPASERGRALGMNALVVALGTSAGPTLGGLITESLSWRWIFYVNVPLGIVGVIATLALLQPTASQNKGRFDPFGALLLAIALASLTGGLSFGQETRLDPHPSLSGLHRDNRRAGRDHDCGTTRALSDHRPVAARQPRLYFSSPELDHLVSGLVRGQLMLPFYFEELRGFPIVTAGFLLTPFPLTIAVIAPFSGRFADRIGTRWLAAGGLAIASLGLFLLSGLDSQSSIIDIIWRLAVVGIGQGLFQSPNNSALLGAAPRDRQGIASGFLATGRVVGQSVSVAIAGAIFVGLGGAAAGQTLTNQAAGQSSADLLALQHTFLIGFRATFLVCAALAVFGVVCSLARGNEQS